MSRITENDILIMNYGTTELVALDWFEYDEENEENRDDWKCYMCWEVYSYSEIDDITYKTANGNLVQCKKCKRVFQ